MDQRTYHCPKCGQVVTKTAEEMKGNPFTKGQLPAFLVCGVCFSKYPSKPAPRMWGDDIPEEDRNDSVMGVERLFKELVYERVKDISFGGRYHGKCVRYLVCRILHGRFEDDDLLMAAEEEVDALTGSEKVNAIAVRFCRSRGEAMRGIVVAEMEWCPGGVWGNADTVKAGDYAKHEYNLVFNRT